jgi:hypothetical protein
MEIKIRTSITSANHNVSLVTIGVLWLTLKLKNMPSVVKFEN